MKSQACSNSEYLSVLADRMRTYKLKPIDLFPPEEVEVCYHRKRLSFFAGGYEYIYCPVMIMQEELTPSFYDYYCTFAFNFIIGNTIKGSPIWRRIMIYPLLITSNITRNLLTHLSQALRPKHINAFEFPVIVDVTSGLVHYQKRTPFFGGGFFPYFRWRARRFFELL
jgi:hypothetical protein